MTKNKEKPTPKINSFEVNDYEINLLKELRRIGYGEVTIKIRENRPYQTVQPLKSKLLDPNHYTEEK